MLGECSDDKKVGATRNGVAHGHCLKSGSAILLPECLVMTKCSASSARLQSFSECINLPTDRTACTALTTVVLVERNIFKAIDDEILPCLGNLPDLC